MDAYDHSRHRRPAQTGRLSSKWVIALIGFAVIAGVLLFTEHRGHVLGALIWLPLLLCPLMHMFMHGGHGGHASQGRDDRQRRAS
jgi:hypothetical protein